jgi:hypothetical protein
MRSAINQRMIERAIRACSNAGYLPNTVECHPDGMLVLCFGESKVSTEDGLDQELEQWKRKHAAN